MFLEELREEDQVYGNNRLLNEICTKLLIKMKKLDLL